MGWPVETRGVASVRWALFHVKHSEREASAAGSQTRNSNCADNADVRFRRAAARWPSERSGGPAGAGLSESPVGVTRAEEGRYEVPREAAWAPGRAHESAKRPADLESDRGPEAAVGCDPRRAPRARPGDGRGAWRQLASRSRVRARLHAEPGARACSLTLPVWNAEES